jgi:hypothetical protein
MTLESVMNYSFDGATVMVVLASIAGVLPPIAGLVGIIYYALLISDHHTIQAWLKRRRVHKLIKLRQQATALELQLSQVADESEMEALRAASTVHMAADTAASQILHDRPPVAPPADLPPLPGAMI